MSKYDLLLKQAGVVPSNALKSVARTGGGLLAGAGMGISKGVSANEQNPNSSDTTQFNNVAGGALGGAAIGGALAGPGVGLAKKGLGSVKNLFSGIKKVADEEVLESPNEDEKKKENNKVTNEEKKEKIAFYLDEIDKIASLKSQERN